MKTKLLILFLTLFVCCCCFSQKKIEKAKNVKNQKKYEIGSEIYRDRMRELIREIKRNTSNDKLLITQNGNELYFYKGEMNKEFFYVTDGTTQESLYYGAGFKLTNPTPEKENEQLLNWLLPIRKAGKPVFAINYGIGEKARADLLKKSVQTNFVNELLPSFGAEMPYVPIQNFNSRNINLLSDVKNFLVLLDPKKFKDIDAFFEYLKETDYDLLLIEPSHSGKFMTKEQISALKRKKNGGVRKVIAYFSIGEAGDYRNYWKEEWNNENKRPSWIVEENPDWKGDFIVKYWSNEWKQIVKDYQKKLDEIGVDGYLLDTVDTYYKFEDKSEKTGNLID